MLELIRSKIMNIIKDRYLATKKPEPLCIKIKRILDEHIDECPTSKKKKQQSEPQPPSTENELEHQPPSIENELDHHPPNTKNEPEPPINASRGRRKTTPTVIGKTSKRGKGGFKAPRVVVNQDVEAPNGVPAVSQREQRRNKRALIKLEQRRTNK
ncbi:hypothetical protein LIER_43402 [Lithospermum erythrorhizon]|uniref:Uncharacterized protein n=1 Tax=Lithospermum erythrorhizon TaxID=34254 RepID=A0AAV3Q242_LITER